MPRFSANLSTMFTDVPVPARFARAAAAGFAAVEMQFPYDVPAEMLRREMDAAGQRMVLINAPPGDAGRGERGLGCLPDRRGAFRDSVLRALDVAGVLGCPTIHVMAGLAPAGCSHDLLTGTLASNLAWATDRAAAQDVTLSLEPINQRDVPGFFLTTMAQGDAMVRAVGAGNLGLQFDVYHCQMTEGAICHRLAAHAAVIRHIQIADAPGRHEPGTGEIGWHRVLRAIDDIGYRGFVGCEYTPAGLTEDGLTWMAPYRS